MEYCFRCSSYKVVDIQTKKKRRNQRHQYQRERENGPKRDGCVSPSFPLPSSLFFFFFPRDVHAYATKIPGRCMYMYAMTRKTEAQRHGRRLPTLRLGVLRTELQKCGMGDRLAGEDMKKEKSPSNKCTWEKKNKKRLKETALRFSGRCRPTGSPIPVALCWRNDLGDHRPPTETSRQRPSRHALWSWFSVPCYYWLDH